MLYIILLNLSSGMADLKSRVLHAVIFPFLSPQAKKAAQRQLTEQVTFSTKIQRGYLVKIILFQKKRGWSEKKGNQVTSITSQNIFSSNCLTIYVFSASEMNFHIQHFYIKKARKNSNKKKNPNPCFI